MANGVFNIAKGNLKFYCSLPATNDALIVVLLKATGLEADDTLNNYDDLGALLAAANDEADFTNYVRKVVTSSITAVVDDTNNWIDFDFPDQTWSVAGGASNNSIGKLLVCYDGDTTGGADSAIIPMTYHDFVVTTDASDLVAQIATDGFARAA